MPAAKDKISDSGTKSDETKTAKANPKAKPKAVQSTLSVDEQTLDLYSEDKTPEKEDTWVKWITRNDGSQYIVLRVLNWNVFYWHYTDRDWDPRPYHETDKGKLAVSSVRCRRELKPYLEQNYQGKLKITRQGKGTDTEYTIVDFKEFGD